MRILFLASSHPLPANNGHKLRTWSLLRALTLEGHSVTLLSFAHTDETLPDPAAPSDLCEQVTTVPLSLVKLAHRSDLSGRLRRLSSATPYAIARFTSPEMHKQVTTHLQRHFDAIICDLFTITHVPPTGVPLVYNSDNIEHLILRRYLQIARNPAVRAYAWLEAAKMRRWERHALMRSSVAMTCSPSDQRVMTRLCPTTPVTIVRNVIDVYSYRPVDGGLPNRVLFHGGMDWYPNQDAVIYFGIQILPILRSRLPEVQFVVAGRNPPPSLLQRFARDTHITFTGTLEDMRPELSKASVCVVPLRIGSGTRLKILEAAAMGRPTVSTTIGAEGLGFQHERDILIADDPIGFAESVANILQQPRLRLQLAAGARRTVETFYSLETMRREMRATLAMLGSPARFMNQSGAAS
jgi:glycosyltransferase involved in cell wall biosynthesis